MGCLDAVRLRMDDGRKRGSLLDWGRGVLLELLLSRAGRRVEGSRRRLAESPEERSRYHVEGGPLLFLMVASEHSASEESQSESPNCRGFS